MKRTIKVDALSRVEGEGSLRVYIDDQQVGKVELGVYEPPRFFEGFLRGRDYSEAPDFTARICGICPVAHQLTSCQAMEDALGVRVDGVWRDLRRLIYCGEWIESHALHIFMLHAPDFLGYPDALAMAADHPQVVATGLRIKKLGNQIVRLVGGREIHPINLKVGGFHGPPPERLAQTAGELAWAVEACQEMLQRLAKLSFPDYERDYLLVSLYQPGQYPIDHGERIISSSGLDIPVAEFAEHFQEHHVAHSTALHATLGDEGAYLVGPLARYSLNRDLLSPLAREAAERAGLGAVCRNPFKSILVRGVELLYACQEAQKLVEAYAPPDQPSLPVTAGAGEGFACTEAPRGLLYHSYRLAGDGIIAKATIVTPTSQNQGAMEQDLRDVAASNLGLDQAGLTKLCETTVRNYDPCISCSTH